MFPASAGGLSCAVKLAKRTYSFSAKIKVTCLKSDPRATWRRPWLPCAAPLATPKALRASKKSKLKPQARGHGVDSKPIPPSIGSAYVDGYIHLSCAHFSASFGSDHAEAMESGLLHCLKADINIVSYQVCLLYPLVRLHLFSPQ